MSEQNKNTWGREWGSKGFKTYERDQSGKLTGRFTWDSSPNGPSSEDPVFDRRGNVVARGHNLNNK